jgi:hypothetical protein
MPQQSFRLREAPADAQRAARTKAVEWLRDALKAQGDDKTKVVDDVVSAPDLRGIKIPGVGG